MNIREFYSNIIADVDSKCETLMKNQVLDKSRPDFGGMFIDGLGYATATHVSTGHLLVILGSCYFSNGSKFFGDEKIAERILFAADFIKSQVRPSGFIDLPCNNYDSPPDTSFLLNQLCFVAYEAKISSLHSAQNIYDSLIEIIVSSANCVSKGGFHTPNHRWVVCSALAQAMELEPEKCNFVDTLESYFAETVDINEDGFYNEQSFGIYDKVIDTRFIILAECYSGKKYSKEDFLNIAEANLNNRLDFLNSDYTMDTSVSNRQDLNKKFYLDCVDTFLYLGIEKNNKEFLNAAKTAFDCNGIIEFDSALFFFARHPEWFSLDLKTKPLRTCCNKLLKETGIWRLKEDKFSMTVQKDATSFMSLRFGNTIMTGCRVSYGYFNGPKYVVDTMEEIENGVRLKFKSLYALKEHPAYWMPLGRAVTKEELPYNNLSIRELNKRPEFELYAEITKNSDGIDIHIFSKGGMSAVKFNIEFLFVPNLTVEMDNATFMAKADDTMFLRSGSVRLVKEKEYIALTNGFYAHRSLEMNEGTNGMYRIEMTDFSPVDRTVHIDYGTWSEKDSACFAEKVYIKN